MSQTVSYQTNATLSGTLSLSVDVQNNDANRGMQDTYKIELFTYDSNNQQNGYAVYNSPTGWHDWTIRTLTLTPTSDVASYKVSLTGFDAGYWYGVYGPAMRTPTLSATTTTTTTTYQEVTTYEEVTTSEEVTTYTTETYYTTEVIQPQQGLTVKVYNNLPTANPQRSDTAYNLCKTTTLTNIQNNWGGGDILGCGGDRVLIHYTGYLRPTENITYLMNQADDGFYMDLNGTNVINNWTLKGCGGNWNPVTLQAGQSYAIDAWFFEWGGGACSTLYYQSATSSGVVPASWYSNGASAPLIKDPALLPALQEAQSQYDSALLSYTTAESEWNQAQADQQVAAQASTDGYYLVINTAEYENTTYATLQQVQAQYSSQLQITNQSQSELSSAQSVVAAAEAEVVTANNALTDASAAEADAQADYESTKAEHEAAIEEADLALAAKTAANSTLLAATDTLSTAASEEQSASTILASKQTELGNANALLLQATTNKDQAVTELQQATVEADTAEVTFQTATATLNAADFALTTATTNKTVSEEEVATAEVSLTETNNSVQKVSNISFQEVEQLLTKEPDPEPEPPVEEGSKEIPADLSAENLMEVDLTKVDPTELTEAQAEQLVEAALETFETAEQGSPEYEQALDALYLAAEQDDIELPAELAAIPGLQAATELINFFGNAGADMSPKVREESKKIVVTAVVAAGVAVQAAAGAATSAAVSAGSSTGSSGSRRTGK